MARYIAFPVTAVDLEEARQKSQAPILHIPYFIIPAFGTVFTRLESEAVALHAAVTSALEEAK